MKYKNIVAYGSIIAGLFGCEGNTQRQAPPEPPKYFASVSTNYESGMALTNGDFDGDGDLDLIVGTTSFDKLNDYNSGKLYIFLNDGKGNFTLKEPARK